MNGGQRNHHHKIFFDVTATITTTTPLRNNCHRCHLRLLRVIFNELELGRQSLSRSSSHAAITWREGSREGKGHMHGTSLKKEDSSSMDLGL